MERYEAYKDSGVEWLGEIPVGWEVKRFRYAFDLITDKAGDNLLKIGLENIESESGKFIATDTEFEGDGIHFLSGDILFGKLRPYLSKVYLADFQGKAVGDFFVFRSKGEIQDQFGAKLILSKRFIDITNSSTYGSKMPRVSWDFISELLIAYPNIEEQTAIANFLDRKTAEIDALIAQKERLLELYEEEKTAIINHAITKGLDPNAELKDSRVEWLGEIPVRWKVMKLKYLLNESLKYGANESALLENREHPRYIRITDFGRNGKLREETFKSLPPEIANDYILENGDILFARSGATVGKTFQFKDYEGTACFAGYLIKASPKAEVINSDFLYEFTKSSYYEKWKESTFNQATIQNIGADKYAMLNVPVPPNIEQTAIANYLDRNVREIDAKIAKTQRIIELQKEYRTALISEVVTGKIKVPELPTQEASA